LILCSIRNASLVPAAVWLARVLSIVGIVLVFMLALSVGMTRISNRSVVQNFVLAFFAVALIAAVGLAVAAVMTRW
jgi:uncharacterized membrane protein